MAILGIIQEIIRGEDHAFISLINNELRLLEIVDEYMPRTDEAVGSIPICSTMSPNDL